MLGHWGPITTVDELLESQISKHLVHTSPAEDSPTTNILQTVKISA